MGSSSEQATSGGRATALSQAQDNPPGSIGGWIGAALEITATIGKIAGLLSGDDAQGVVDIGPRGVGEYPELGQVTFFNMDGETYAWNQSVKTYADLFFPGDALLGVDGQEILLPPGDKKFPVSSMFRTCAEADVDAFTVQPMTPFDVETKDTGDPVYVSAQARRPFPPGETVNIPPYFNFRLNVSDRTVRIGVTGGLLLGAIALLNIQGAGDTLVRIINAVRKPTATEDDDQHITVDIPEGIIISNGLTSIDICAAVDNLVPSVEQFMREHGDRFTPLTEEDRAKLRAAAAARS